MTNTVPTHIGAIPQYYEDEIDLVDLWLILVRRRRVFFSVSLVIVIAAAAYLALAPRTYEARAVLQIGYLSASGTGEDGKILNVSLEPPTTLIERLSEEYRLNDDKRIERPLPRLGSIKSNKAQTDIVTITAEARSPQEAEEFLRSATAKIQREHDQLFTEFVRARQEQLEALKVRAASLKALLAAASDARLGEPAVVAERIKATLELRMIERDISTLEFGLSPLRSVPTRPLRDPVALDIPVKPRITLIAVIAIVAAGMLGLIAVFLAEFVGKVRERTRITGAPVA